MKKEEGFSICALAFLGSRHRWRSQALRRELQTAYACFSLAIAETAPQHEGLDFSNLNKGTESSQVFGQVRDQHAKGLREGSQIQDGDIALAALDRPYKGPVQPTPFGKLFLSQPTCLPSLPKAVAQFAQESFVIEVHCA